MARVSRVYSSRFVQAIELSRDTHVPAMIEQCWEETLGTPPVEKLVLKISDGNGWEKDLVLNQTNARVLAAAFGDDTDEWLGQQVELWSEEVMFRGDPVLSVKIAPAPPPAQPALPLPKVRSELDDDIPF